jgi:hypothetical protein
MVTIAWNPNGFHLTGAMPKGEKHSARYHINKITISIYQRLIPAGKRKLVIHPDNSQCHTPKIVLNCVSQRTVGFAPHPLDSLDITPFDFFVSVCLKHEL